MRRSGALTARQQLVLSFVNETVRDKGAPPTVREVMEHCGLRSPRGAELQLKALAKCGHLVHEPGVKRAYRPRLERPASAVPILGRAPAGYPADQAEIHEGTLPVPWRVGDDAFAVRVVGESMRDAAILDGDLVVIDRKREPRNGDVVLAVIGGEQTIKRLCIKANRWILQPANPAFPELSPEAEGDQVLGCVVGLVRQMRSA